MVFKARIAILAAVLASTCLLPVLANEATMAGHELVLHKGLKLDAQRLLNMKPGEQIAIDFPVLGRQNVTFETTTRGLDGRTYWHGRVGTDPRDRVFLKQTATGFVGAVRLAGRQVAFEQRANGALAPVTEVAPVTAAGQAYAVGAQLARGAFELHSNLAALAQAQPGSEMALPLPGGQTEVAIVTQSRVDEHGFQQIAGINRMDGVAAPVVLTISPDAVFGSIITSRGEYQIITRAGRTSIFDPRAAGLTPPHGDDQMSAPADLGQVGQHWQPATQAMLRNAGGGGATTPPANTAPQPQLPPLPPNTIDTTLNLLVTYSTSFVALWGTELAARTRLSNLLELANSAHANSGTGLALRIVGWRLVAAPDDTPQNQLINLRLDREGFEGTADQKAQQGAAMTVFFAPLNSVTVSTNTCGIAYVPGAYAAGLTAYYQQLPSLTFAALNDGQFDNQYCESLSLTHELGHLLGAVHDKANAPFMGVYDYSYGKGVPGVFGTVMSYISPRVALFSSPQLICSGDGQPCGSSSENVVGTILRTKPFAAALGQSDVSAASPDTGLGRVMMSGWLLQSGGVPYFGSSSVKATDARVQCRAGRTGFYTCSVPASLHSVTLKVEAPGRVVQPSVATFSVVSPASGSANSVSAAAMVGRFYVH
jgi:hypothetical protein